MNFAETIGSLYPCRQNGIDSLAAGYVMIGMFTMTVIYFGREKNRRYIGKWFGFNQQKMDLGEKNEPYKMVIIWNNVFLFAMAHLGSLLAIYLFLFVTKWQTFCWAIVLFICSFFSIPGGCHRLYSHRAFKASKLYEVVIMIFNCILMQNSIIHWARDHRCHHKFVDTNADPHTPSRGMFFAHIGWLMVERHPDVIKQGKKIDISDLTSNPILAFQRKYYGILIFIFHVCIPFFVPQIFWGERFWSCWFCCINFPWCLSLNSAGMINSYAHYAGVRPYNKNISPADGIGPWRHIVTLGEGNHNYHHTFPQDYRSSESKSILLFSTHIIDVCSWFGLTYDLKVMSQDMIDRAKLKHVKADELHY